MFGNYFSIKLSMRSIYTVRLFAKKEEGRKKGVEETSEKSEELEGKGQGTISKRDYPLL